MPTYSYRCTACDNAFDIHQQFADASLTECSSCGGQLRKVFGNLGVTFNGTGFYRNDSRSASKPVSSSSASESGGTTSGT
ncbi:FmdB family zinc ribbon protein [Paramicrobacterium chengjingii]|uniref:FmdB family transcriptional regulator n=1 Tax=Paramicrobacterium chengjingii TaxID=2769067 RepID=A0ABX6YF01_9MICO|nr:FmdB family zinc ribbon protein [Microbacterium chengjingii]QPZ37347.1 FmdB family transcriptional regulator [Microbacterium chengjingii]